jgi:hypothetical protein
MLLMISPPFPMIEPTSLPVMIIRMVRVTLGVSFGNGLSMSDILDLDLEFGFRCLYIQIFSRNQHQSGGFGKCLGILGYILEIKDEFVAALKQFEVIELIRIIMIMFLFKTNFK